MHTRWALALIALALVGRLIPHPDNFTPLLAVALFGAALLPARIACVVPLAALLLSDVALGHAFGPMTVVVYGCYAFASLLGLTLRSRRSWVATGAATLTGSVLFYAATNFAVWATAIGRYAPTWDGLVECYVMALPFFRNQLAGDLFWTAALFGLFDLGQRSLPVLRAGPSRR